MVVQVNLQGIDRAPPFGLENFLRSIGQHHLQRGAVGRQMKALPAGQHNPGIDFNGAGFHVQLLGAKLGQ
ncbi:hypothetical protein GALL_540760 [mine drainage metagenome]|uniref:Uncharacterized protein n=1 Tax=mine drainage metagenome TaxID=410659 RepID=A0A1J5NZW1_9ZZZZ